MTALTRPTGPRLQKRSALFRDGEMEDGEQLLRIGPNAGSFAETGGGRESCETFHGVFVGKFRDDFFAIGKSEFPATDMGGLFAGADEMHFDPAFIFVVNRAVLPATQIEIRAQVAIGPNE